MHRLAAITTDPLIVDWFLRPHLAAWSRFAKVTLMVNMAVPHSDFVLDPRVQLEPVAIQRRIAPFRDLLTLYRLIRAFRRGRYSGVYSVAPKAGLLAMLAAWIARVPLRCHVFQGEVWNARRGPMRWLLRSADRITAAVATDILVVSESERQFLVREGVIDPGKALVLGKGSISGVDPARFRPDADARRDVRLAHDIPEGATVISYLGRFSRDKGLFELASAFTRISSRHPDTYMFLIGPDEDKLVPRLIEILEPVQHRVRFVGFTRAPERYLAASDILALPSLREGFPMVLIEAAAVGIPAVASSIYGISDAMIDGVTGLMHPPRDAAATEKALEQLIEDPELRRKLGEAGRARALSEFEAANVVQRTADFLKARLDRQHEAAGT